MQDYIIQIMNEYGYLGVIFLITVENVFPPIPSEVILTFGGFMTTYTEMSVMGFTVFSTVGSVLGAFILYYVGYFLSPAKMEKIITGRIGKILRLDMDAINRSSQRFQKKGKTTVFFCRFVPIIRSLISIPAGMAGMDIAVFTVLTALGSFIWNIVLVSLGAAAGASWVKISGYVKEYGKAGKMIFWMAAAFLITRYIWKKLRMKKKNPAHED